MNYQNQINKILESFKHNPDREKHMDLLANAFFEYLQRDECEYGGWGLDSKRPFGNSVVSPDIAEIVGLNRDFMESDDTEYVENMTRYLDNLYDDLGPYLNYKWQKLNSNQ